MKIKLKGRTLLNGYFVSPMEVGKLSEDLSEDAAREFVRDHNLGVAVRAIMYEWLDARGRKQPSPYDIRRVWATMQKIECAYLKSKDDEQESGK